VEGSKVALMGGREEGGRGHLCVAGVLCHERNERSGEGARRWAVQAMAISGRNERGGNGVLAVGGKWVGEPNTDGMKGEGGLQ
jgi:hypothetical protein